MVFLRCRSPDWMKQGQRTERDCLPSFCGCYNRRMLLVFFADSLAPALHPPRPPNPFPQSCFPPLCLYCCWGFSLPRWGTWYLSVLNFVKFPLDKPLRYYYYHYLSLTIQPNFFIYLVIHSSKTVVSHLGYENTVRQSVKSFAKGKVLPLHPQIQTFWNRRLLDWSNSW